LDADDPSPLALSPREGVKLGALLKDRVRVYRRAFEEIGSAKASSIRVPFDPPTRATKPAIIEPSDEPLAETLSSGERAG
jgi:hypothetical protein